MYRNRFMLPVHYSKIKDKRYGPLRGGSIAPTNPIAPVAPQPAQGNFIGQLGALANIILPIISSIVIRKLLDGKKSNDKQAIKEFNTIVNSVKDDKPEKTIKELENSIKEIKKKEKKGGEINNDSRSLLNKIMGRGIMEIK